MPRLLALFLSICALGLSAGCTKVDTEVKRAKMNEDFGDLIKGRDRGYFGYREMIEAATVRGPREPRYQYNKPAWVSNYMVTRAIRGLGGTEWPNADYLAGSVDRLLYVLHYDPIPIVRAEACSQLGRIARRTGLAAASPYPYVQLADEKIQQDCHDLFQLKLRLDKGERIKQSLVIDGLESLDQLYPTQLLLAVQMMRALSSAPVVQAPPGPLRDVTERVIPAIARRAISIALGQLSCGSVYRPNVGPDESPEVRARALEVLVALDDPVAAESAIARLWDEDYPEERDDTVRMRLLEYLGRIGGPRAFEAALHRLDYDSLSVRFHAHAALLHMTGVKVAPTPEAWAAWRKEHPAWQMPSTAELPTLQPAPSPATTPEPAIAPDK